jgi:hypothetical protein
LPCSGQALAKVRAEKHYAISGSTLRIDQIGSVLERAAMSQDWRIDQRARGSFVATGTDRGKQLTATFAYTLKEVIVSYTDDSANVRESVAGTPFKSIDGVVKHFPMAAQELRDLGRFKD